MGNVAQLYCTDLNRPGVFLFRIHMLISFTEPGSAPSWPGLEVRTNVACVFEGIGSNRVGFPISTYHNSFPQTDNFFTIYR
jgi:hypothetical protein